MTPLEVLQAARALIEKPEHWCIEALARNSSGQLEMVESLQAKKFCLLGAIRRITRNNYETETLACGQINSMLKGHDLIGWQDTHTHAEVIGLLDTAIAELRQ